MNSAFVLNISHPTSTYIEDNYEMIIMILPKKKDEYHNGMILRLVSYRFTNHQNIAIFRVNHVSGFLFF